MFTIQFEISSLARPAGRINLTGGTWVGDECIFEFSENVFGMSGLIRCDWRKAAPDFEIQEGPTDAPEAWTMLAKVSELLAGYHTGTFAGVTDEQLAQLYSQPYHTKNNYTGSTDNENMLKGRLAELVIQLAKPRRVLVAGCSAGECIRQLRARGVEAWGFDLCPDLQGMAYDEVKPYLRVGSITDIPFGAEDGFDTLTALDLFEHVPEDRVPIMVEQIDRLGVQNVAALIAMGEFQYEGHITLRPLHWWDAQMAPHFRRERFDSIDAHPARGILPDLPEASRLLRFYERIGPVTMPQPELATHRRSSLRVAPAHSRR